MKNILVPTDFSEAAKGAFLFAQQLAERMDASLKVVHVCHPSYDPSQPYIIDSLVGYEEIKRELLEKFVRVSDQVNVDTVITDEMIEREVILGFAAEEIVNLTTTKDVDLVVMGTKGEGGFFENLFGSVSSHVSQKAHCPVLLVPEGVKYTGFRNIAYASNYESADDRMMHTISDFANRISAGIHLVHVNESGKKEYHLEELLLEEVFRRKAPELSLKMSSVESETVWEGLNIYADNNDIDMIVMVTRHRNLWEKLTHKSQTRELIFHAKYPILIMHMDDPNHDLA